MTVLLENEPLQSTSSALNLDTRREADILDDPLLKIQSSSSIKLGSNPEDNDTHSSNPTSDDDDLSEGSTLSKAHNSRPKDILSRDFAGLYFFNFFPFFLGSLCFITPSVFREAPSCE